MPRYCRFSVRTRRSLTIASVTAPRARAGATPASQAASDGTRTGRPLSSTTLTRRRGPGWEPAADMVPSGSAGGDAALTERLVRFDDLLDEAMAHHVLVVEVNERDALDLRDNLERLDEPRRARARQVDLRDVAGDDRLRAKPEARQEHLHLLAGGVLRLVENDEGIVERAAAHEGQRRDLDDALGDELLGALDVHHVVQRVVERPEVGVDLLLHRPGEEAELLAGLDGGTGEDDALDLF